MYYTHNFWLGERGGRGQKGGGEPPPLSPFRGNTELYILCAWFWFFISEVE